MMVSARCEYACRALLELSQHWPERKPIRIQTISTRQKIPMRYLVQILIQLKRAGLVASVRGKEGGYNLAKPPGKISVGEVMRYVSGPILPAPENGTKEDSVFVSVWKEVEDAMSGVLNNVSFDDMAKDKNSRENAIFYHI